MRALQTLAGFLVFLVMIVLSTVFPTVKIAIGVTMLILIGIKAVTSKSYLWGIPLTGGIMNMTAMLVNGGRMPVSGAGFELDQTHVAMTSGTHLKVLCDIIHVGTSAVLSFGDLFFVIWLLAFLGVGLYTKYRKVK